MTAAYRAVMVLLIVTSIAAGILLGGWVHTTLST